MDLDPGILYRLQFVWVIAGGRDGFLQDGRAPVSSGYA
jgi:hypothetical protein